MTLNPHKSLFKSLDLIKTDNSQMLLTHWENLIPTFLPLVLILAINVLFGVQGICQIKVFNSCKLNEKFKKYSKEGAVFQSSPCSPTGSLSGRTDLVSKDCS